MVSTDRAYQRATMSVYRQPPSFADFDLRRSRAPGIEKRKLLGAGKARGNFCEHFLTVKFDHSGFIVSQRSIACHQRYQSFTGTKKVLGFAPKLHGDASISICRGTVNWMCCTRWPTNCSQAALSTGQQTTVCAEGQAKYTGNGNQWQDRREKRKQVHSLPPLPPNSSQRVAHEDTRRMHSKSTFRQSRECC